MLPWVAGTACDPLEICVVAADALSSIATGARAPRSCEATTINSPSTFFGGVEADGVSESRDCCTTARPRAHVRRTCLARGLSFQETRRTPTYPHRGLPAPTSLDAAGRRRATGPRRRDPRRPSPREQDRRRHGVTRRHRREARKRHAACGNLTSTSET